MFKNILKKLYYSLPFKKHCFLLVKKVFPLPERIYKHLHFKGKILVSVNKSQKFRMVHYGFIIENEGVREIKNLEVSDCYNVLLCRSNDVDRIKSKFLVLN